MTRLIDADTLEYGSASTGEYVFEYVPKYQIDNAPTIDAVPVVRCKDCASFRYSGMGGDNGITYCASMGIEMQPTDFCSYGERKDDE